MNKTKARFKIRVTPSSGEFLFHYKNNAIIDKISFFRGISSIYYHKLEDGHCGTMEYNQLLPLGACNSRLLATFIRSSSHLVGGCVSWSFSARGRVSRTWKRDSIIGAKNVIKLLSLTVQPNTYYLKSLQNVN